MSKNYYGGGYIGTSLLETTQPKNSTGYNILTRGATWPFFKLTLNNGSVTLRTPWTVINQKVDQINNVSLELPATIKFQFKEKNDSFGFIYLNPIRLVNALSAQGINVTRVDGGRLKSAQIFIILFIVGDMSIVLTVIAGAIGVFK